MVAQDGSGRGARGLVVGVKPYASASAVWGLRVVLDEGGAGSRRSPKSKRPVQITLATTSEEDQLDWLRALSAVTFVHPLLRTALPAASLQLREELGGGAYGSVFRGTIQGNTAPVAVKLLEPGGEGPSAGSKVGSQRPPLPPELRC